MKGGKEVREEGRERNGEGVRKGGRKGGGQRWRGQMGTVLNKDLSMQSETDWWSSSGLTFYRQHLLHRLR